MRRNLDRPDEPSHRCDERRISIGLRPQLCDETCLRIELIQPVSQRNEIDSQERKSYLLEDMSYEFKRARFESFRHGSRFFPAQIRSHCCGFRRLSIFAQQRALEADAR